MKHMRRFTALVLALVMALSLTVSAGAAAAQTVTVKLSPNITVMLDGTPQAMTDVNGSPVYPVLYNGTTYLPVRAVGNMLGLDVDWDGATQTVLLTASDNGEPAGTTGRVLENAKSSDITVRIRPDITVKLDGETQKMTNVNGDPVYPMLYNGTTYLPVRAVGNMLGLEVDWSGTFQTVVLRRGTTTISAIVQDINGDNVTVQLAYGWGPDEIRQALLAANVDPSLIDGKIEEIISLNSYFSNSSTNVDIGWFKDAALEFMAPGKTSDNAELAGEDHVSCDWCEIDYSTAMDGYIRVRIKTNDTNHSNCIITWYDPEPENGDYLPTGTKYPIVGNDWAELPLDGKGGFYRANIEEGYSNWEMDAVRDNYEKDKFNLSVNFEGKPAGDERWLMSTNRINFKADPKVGEKALEITRNCKTDAEKVTAVFRWVASNIKYDYSMFQEIIAYDIASKANDESVDSLFRSGARQCLLPGNILKSRTGVCEDYAVLMAAMLRSLGIPCRGVHGEVYDGKIIKGYNDDNPGWMPHAWVEVDPEYCGGLDWAALGAGHGTDGWIRLDPTWGNTVSGRAAASVDANHKTTSTY